MQARWAACKLHKLQTRHPCSFAWLLQEAGRSVLTGTVRMQACNRDAHHSEALHRYTSTCTFACQLPGLWQTAVACIMHTLGSLMPWLMAEQCG